VHGFVLASAILVTAGLTPTAAVFQPTDVVAEPARLIFLATPGPGGGGGGGGRFERTPPPRAERAGTPRRISSPVLPEKPAAPTAAPVPPKPPLAAESLPVVIAPVAPAPADPRTRIGVLDESASEADSRGPGGGSGAGSGVGSGIGEGHGPGIGAGSGGGIGGGPYRPGSGVEPPRLLREVKATYTEEARLHGVSGEVILELVVRRDGTVGDVRVLEGLGDGLNERAVQAVRQWRFAPGRRQGAPVDVLVEVSVEFRQR
jgi:TonB family protein